MSYQVIARKYRPQTFDEVVGQDAVVATLKNAIASKRLHHAYLFAGARGIGKTSLARIFAKAVNCAMGPTPVPCNECTQCREITAGNCLDVYEIDGASNTSVDDVRELREGLKYLPASARYKIYIIDEVHMLSGSAFNALLKTLEEPPPHVIFLFATTESHKIPATILSRCQRFDLRRIPSEQILSKLTAICEQEKIQSNSDTLLLITREAAGSLRDAQSLLDQAIAYTGGSISVELVSSMLGLVDTRSIHQITDKVLRGHTAEALLVVQEIYERGHDLKQFAIQWLNHWRNLLVYRSTQSEKTLIDLTEVECSEIIRQSGLVSLPAFDIGFQLLYRGVEEIGRSEFPKLLFDVLVVRLSHVTEIESLQEILDQIKSGVSFSSRVEGKSATATNYTTLSPSPQPSPVEGEGDRKEATSSPSDLTVDSIPSLTKFLQQVSSERPQVGSLLGHMRASVLDQDKIYFQFDPGGIWMELLADRKAQIEAMAKDFFRRPLQIIIQNNTIPLESGEVVMGKISAQEQATHNDPMVSSALNILNAQIEEVNR
jgi:DNA polymerase-3 subunit gamma/tau